MNNELFIDDWNSIIPFKIKSSDLEKPSEQFLYRAILSFFRLLHYDVSGYENMYGDTIETLSLKRVELVTMIDYIYQLCSDSQQTSFFYVDLVKPTTKKVIHLLKILLNYLFYLKMVQDTVREKTIFCSETFFELNARLNQEQISKEEMKIRVKNINRYIDDLKNSLPEVNCKIESLEHENMVLQDKLITIKGSLETLGNKLVNLKIERVNMTERKVTDEEVRNLKSCNESLERDIILLTNNERQQQITNATHVKTICEMRPCVVILEKLIELHLDDSCKRLRQDIEEIKSLYDKAEHNYNSSLSALNAMLINYTDIEGHLEAQRQALGVRLKVFDRRTKKNYSSLIVHKMFVDALDANKELLERLLEAQRLEVERIKIISSQSFNLIKETF